VTAALDGRSPRIAIIGAGAMGCIFGAALGDAGIDVTLVEIARPLVEHINVAGVTSVRGVDEQTTRVPATDDPGAIGEVDAAIVFVKCYHTESAATFMQPLVGPTTTVTSLQNGWGNEELLAHAFGADRVVAGVTYHSGTTFGLGRVSHNAPGPTFIGPFVGDDITRCAPLERALATAGFEVTATPDVRTEVWKKLVFNAAGLAAGALTGLDPQSAATLPEVRELVSALAREAVAVATASGYEIEPEERIATITAAFERAAPGTKGSMRQDFEAGRRTEVDVVNGAVVREAAERGIDAPLNRAMVALVKGVEAVRERAPAS
jgi:2-dehydropantoate 2-reductase